MSTKEKNKVLVILGPTASGKTSLAIELAKKYNGEIISADSRQVYTGMDIGTGKDLKDYGKTPYHLIDVCSPNEKFSMALYQKLAFEAIDKILAKGKLPIIAGGSGLYLQAVVDNYSLSNSKPNEELRKTLEEKTLEDLQIYLKNLDKNFFKKINDSDKKNKRRLIRYIEVLQQNKSNHDFLNKKKESKYAFLLIGLKWTKEELDKRIKLRLIERLDKENMVDEIKRLHKEGVSWERLESFGLEYRFISRYVCKKINYEEMVEKLFIAIRQFAKRQMTWFRRWEKEPKNIFWFKTEDKKNIFKKIENFL